MSWFELWRADLLAPRYMGWLFDGWLVTLWASALVIAASTALGLLLAVARASPRPVLRWLTAAYVSAFRNTPLLVQLFF